MPVPDFVQQTLWHKLVMLDWRTGRYVLRVFDAGTQSYQNIGSTSAGGSPLILPGDPPDFVITADGDLIMVDELGN